MKEKLINLGFSKFSKSLPLKKLIDTKHVIAFHHPRPTHEIHILIVPKKKIGNITTADDSETYIIEVLKAVQKLVRDLNLEKPGYSLITNGGPRQKVKQLHFHLISGKNLG